MTKNRPIVLLSEAFPDCLDGDGIFSEMTEMPWSEDVDADLLDLDYFGNHSGQKKCSPVVYALMEDDHTLDDSSRLKLANLIKAKFLPNWTALWNSYHLEYDPITDFSMTEEGEHTDGASTTRTGSVSGTNTGTDNTSHVHGHVVGEQQAGTNTGTDNTNLVHGETIGTQEAISKSSSLAKYGFNSSEAVPTDTSSEQDSDTKTEQHSGTDQNNRTLNLSDSKTRTEQHSGTDQENKTLNLANSETRSESERTDKGGDYSKTRIGLTGSHTIQSIIREERELWIEDYFTRVYSDVDSVLASLIYNREHGVSPYYLIGFGYYQI